jgi:hypothetical protein
MEVWQPRKFGRHRQAPRWGEKDDDVLAHYLGTNQKRTRGATASSKTIDDLRPSHSQKYNEWAMGSLPSNTQDGSDPSETVSDQSTIPRKPPGLRLGVMSPGMPILGVMSSWHVLAQRCSELLFDSHFVRRPIHLCFMRTDNKQNPKHTKTYRHTRTRMPPERMALSCHEVRYTLTLGNNSPPIGEHCC